MDFKTNFIALYNEMRWKENKTAKEAQICRDFRVFITTKFPDNDTRMALNAVGRGDYDPEKKTLNPTLIPSSNPGSPQSSQPNHTSSPNIPPQSGNAVEVEGVDAEELLQMSDESAKEAVEFATEIKKRGRKPKI